MLQWTTLLFTVIVDHFRLLLILIVHILTSCEALEVKLSISNSHQSLNLDLQNILAKQIILPKYRH